MTRKLITIAAIVMLTTLFLAGAVSATADITIKPDSGPNVGPDGTIYVPVGVDAASIGLGVQYSGFVAGNPYSQDITDSSLVVVPGTSSSGGLTTGNDFISIHWTPGMGDKGKTFSINAEATTGTGKRVKTIKVTAPGVPTPELSTGALSAVGILGLIGLVYRRKND